MQPESTSTSARAFPVIDEPDAVVTVSPEQLDAMATHVKDLAAMVGNTYGVAALWAVVFSANLSVAAMSAPQDWRWIYFAAIPVVFVLIAAVTALLLFLSRKSRHRQYLAQLGQGCDLAAYTYAARFDTHHLDLALDGVDFRRIDYRTIKTVARYADVATITLRDTSRLTICRLVYPGALFSRQRPGQAAGRRRSHDELTGVPPAG